jgi:hypothetical protein
MRASISPVSGGTPPQDPSRLFSRLSSSWKTGILLLGGLAGVLGGDPQGFFLVGIKERAAGLVVDDADVILFDAEPEAGGLAEQMALGIRFDRNVLARRIQPVAL